MCSLLPILFTTDVLYVLIFWYVDCCNKPLLGLHWFFFSQPVPLSILKSSILSKKQNKQAKTPKLFLMLLSGYNLRQFHMTKENGLALWCVIYIRSHNRLAQPSFPFPLPHLFLHYIIATLYFLLFSENDILFSLFFKLVFNCSVLSLPIYLKQ